MLLASGFVHIGTLKASFKLHDDLLIQVLRAPMSFFDTTPLGRILNRFTKDVQVLDNNLPVVLELCIRLCFTILGWLLLMSFVTPYIVIIVLIPITLIYYIIQHFYVCTSRSLKRLESISISPVYAHFAETICGLNIIRAFGVESRFFTKTNESIDLNLKCIYPEITARSWLLFCTETIGSIVVSLTTLCTVLKKGVINPSVVGMSVSGAMQVSKIANNFILVAAEVLTYFISIERIHDYTNIPQEAPWTVSQNIAPNDWPSSGIIEFLDFSARYKEGSPLILKQISCLIKSKEKIGVVGRTGAGKSSISLSLFRIIEASSGEIHIDGVNIAKLGLHVLRSNISIIPQDPVLFSGSLRFNLDPCLAYNDDQIWKALESAHLKTFVTNLKDDLDYKVNEGGENLSIGQRQLICLARALLRNKKILVLDEATAAIDLETDNLIQKTIRDEFKACTVLTIAHRINTIMDSDRVLVLDKGRIAEFDKPDTLLKNKSSIFYRIAQEAGFS